MSHTGYENQSLPKLKHIKGFSQRNGDFLNAEELDMKLAYAAGGLVSTTEDLYKWNKAIFSNKVLTKASLDLAHSKFKLNNGTTVPYGFGWEIGEIKGFKSIKHDGIINGFISFALYLPQMDIFVSVLTNCDCTAYIEEVSSKLSALAAGDPYIIEKVSKTKSELLIFQGIYESEVGEKQIIGYQDGQLYSYSAGARKYPLTTIGNNTLVIEPTLSAFHFETSADGKVTSYLTETFDYKTKWKKISDNVQTLEAKKISSSTFEQYVGKYQVKDAFLFEVYSQDGKMFGSVQGDTKEIKTYDKDKFYTLNSDIKLEFTRNTDGVVSEVLLFLPVQMNAKKID